MTSRFFAKVFGAAALAVWLLAANLSRAQEPAAGATVHRAPGDCMACHADPASGSPQVHQTDKSAHAKLKCNECHVDDAVPPCPPKLPAVKCDTCHQDQVKALGSSEHGKAILAEMKKTVDKVKIKDICLACHGPDVHALTPHTEETSAVARGNVSASCLSCHQDRHPEMFAEFKESIHSTRKEDNGGPAATCADCHGGHAINSSAVPDSMLSRQKTHETCGACHEAAKNEYMTGIHYQALQSGGADMPTCTDCHGKHNIFDKNDVRSRINHLQVDSTCISCHANKNITDRHDNLPSPEFVQSYEDSVHGRGVHTKGLMVSASCSDCHGNHGMLPKKDPKSSVNHANIPNTCKECHRGIFEDFERSEHGHLWKNNNRNGPVCTTCHTAHEIQEPTRLLFNTFKITQECAGCHDEKSKTYKDTFHGKTTSMGFLVAAKCSDCHTPHHNLKASDPDSSVNPAHLVQTCGKCHERVNENFVKYDPHPDPHNIEKSALLYWTKIFMELLIIGTFGFFGLHTLLWLQRSVVAFIRKEEEVSFPLEGVKHVRRWSRTAVIMHIVIVTSFLGLVATGLPLRYYFTDWARVLGSVYGGVEVARYIHRFCAAITIGYAVFHLAYLLRQIVIKKEFKLLYGPDSMVPRWKDLQDLRANFKYFLYRGAPPRFGKWTYYEKFDYFALFWGVPIVVISGLVMLFPTFFSIFIPGYALNVASLVHSEEALLAAGFIFVFHFFHNHLRPGVIPMDINIFTGTMPLERLIQERPEEYERLKKEGLFDDLVIDAPERRVLWESRLFGFFALLTGLILVVAIFVSFVIHLGS